MTFASVKDPTVPTNICGKLVEKIFTFTGASGDTGGTIATGITKIKEINISAELSDGSANLAALAVGLTNVEGTIRISYTDPTANHKGRVTVKGFY